MSHRRTWYRSQEISPCVYHIPDCVVFVVVVVMAVVIGLGWNGGCSNGGSI